jgi:hypothetical protein
MWTRNYNNLVNSVITLNNQGQGGASGKAFGDGYTGNFKNPLGAVYEICTYNPNANNYSNYTAHAPFVSRASNGTYGAGISLLKNIQSVISPTTAISEFPNKIFVALGDDDTAETYEDYRIDDVITAVIENAKTATVTENADGTFKIDYHLVVTATEAITIREIGIFVLMPYTAINTTSNCAYYALVNRIVLDQEISAVKDDVVHIDFSVVTPKISVNG